LPHSKTYLCEVSYLHLVQPVSLFFAAYPVSQLDSSLLQLLRDQQGKTVNAVKLTIALMAFACFSSDKVTKKH